MEKLPAFWQWDARGEPEGEGATFSLPESGGAPLKAILRMPAGPREGISAGGGSARVCNAGSNNRGNFEVPPDPAAAAAWKFWKFRFGLNLTRLPAHRVLLACKVKVFPLAIRNRAI